MDMKIGYDEIVEYADGCLVLAPIIHAQLNEKNDTESLNDFILRFICFIPSQIQRLRLSVQSLFCSFLLE